MIFLVLHVAKNWLKETLMHIKLTSNFFPKSSFELPKHEIKM